MSSWASSGESCPDIFDFLLCKDERTEFCGNGLCQGKQSDAKPPAKDPMKKEPPKMKNPGMKELNNMGKRRSHWGALCNIYNQPII